MNIQTLSLLERVLKALEESVDDVTGSMAQLPTYIADYERRLIASCDQLDKHKSCIKDLEAAIAAERSHNETEIMIGDEWKPCVKLPIVVHVREQRQNETHVSTREGITPVKSTDLIMRGVAGEEYPIGRELFDKTYTFDLSAAERSKEQAKPLHTSKTYPDDGGSVIVYDGGAGYPAPTPEMLNGDPLFDAIWNAIKYWDISRDNDGMYSSPSGNDVRHIYDTIKQAKPQQEPVAWTDDYCGFYSNHIHAALGYGNIPLYASPKLLKHLSDDEVDEIFIEYEDGGGSLLYGDAHNFVRAIEAKLGVGK